MAVRRTSLPPVAVGLAGGAAIAAIDLGDHLTFGAIAGVVPGGRG
jgi:hypothetical protein